MKLSDLAKGRPVICRFDDPDDHHGGVIANEPRWQENPYDSAKQQLVVTLAADNDLTYELRVRSQMIDAIRDAVAAAGAKSLEAGGYLDVTFIEYRGQLKVYKATYEPPENDHCGCADSREPIGTAELETDPDDLGDGSDDDAPPW